MNVLAALASHVVGTIASFAFGALSRGRVFDVGHAIVAARPRARTLVELVTFAIPLACRKRLPNKSLATFSVVTFFRGLCIAATILPPLLPVGSPNPLMLFVGHGYDYIFSGHAAYAASWILNSPGYLEWTLGAIQAWGLVASRMHYTVDVLLAWIITWLVNSLHPRPKFALRFVTLCDLDAVAKLRHSVYAEELKHHDARPDKRLPESIELNRVLIGAYCDDNLVGYIGVTMPGGTYSLEMYGFPKPARNSYEIRALCVSKEFRRYGLGKSLIRAAIKFARRSGRDVEIVAMAREQLVDAYVAYGMQHTGEIVCVGGAWYYLVKGRPAEPAASADIAWELPFPEKDDAPCFHGGASLVNAKKTNNSISADVLDAWYDPCPEAVRAASQDVAWAMRTSPPTNCEPLIEAIAAARGVSTNNIAVGAGSSELIFRCFSAWLSKSSRVLLVEPTYGEYSHVLRNVIGCSVDSLHVSESQDFCLDVDALKSACKKIRYDLVVIVNPNSPFGTHHTGLGDVVNRLATRVWIDETYVDYVGQSLEHIAITSPHVVVCKTMSKVYALSGCRVGYVCGHPSVIRSVRLRTPPWIVSRPTQAAAIEAVKNWEYYGSKIEETHLMRKDLERKLSEVPGVVKVFPGCANWTLIKVNGPVSDVVERCTKRGVYVRDTHIPGFCRIAVKREIDAIVGAVRDALNYKTVQ